MDGIKDPEEVVDARFVPGDASATFSLTSALNPEVAEVKSGNVIKLTRREATQRVDFVIVGEEETTAGAVVPATAEVGTERTQDQPKPEAAQGSGSGSSSAPVLPPTPTPPVTSPQGVGDAKPEA